MNDRLLEDNSLHNKYDIFETRKDAGHKLSVFLQNFHIDLLLVIPNGGLPIAQGISEKLSLPEINLLMIRKVQLPWTTESGFGAITPDGQLFVNKSLIDYYKISEKDIQLKVDQAKQVIEKRLEKYGLPNYNVENKVIAIVDDGIASGFSMIAGITWLIKKKAKSVIVGVPTAPWSSLETILERTEVAKIICLNIREHFSFAVADAYKEWYDLSDKEAGEIVKSLLDKQNGKT